MSIIKSRNNLIDKGLFQEPIEVSSYEKDFLLQALRRMILIRLVEEKLADCKKEGLIGGPVHLAAGQEAIAVGIAENLKADDKAFGTHRSHAQLLAINPCFYELFAEILGKETGLSKGMGGSMHLHLNKEDSAYFASVPIVSGTIALAVGAAFHSKLSNRGIGVAFFGDGAVEEGIFHESLNLSKILETPMLFVVENNLFASHMHISQRQPDNFTARFAEANNIGYEIVDGNNILDVFEQSKKLIDECREGRGPKFIELITYRHYGHVDWRKDIDVGVSRSEEDIIEGEKRDPIMRLYLGMKREAFISKDEMNEIKIQLQKDISKAWERALNDPFPASDALMNRVFKA